MIKSVFLVCILQVSTVESLNCEVLCRKSGAPRIGNCVCRMHLFGSKRDSDSALDLEKRDISCPTLCNISGANRIGNCFCRADIFMQKKNIEEYNDFSVNA
ncbi:UNVERIFIED_CONTAM: hypothetical protein NCL1_39981 [Trichonephila clavipes]